MVLQADFVDSIKHQVRWMKSTRFSRPKGHLGTSLTFGVPFGVMAWAGALLLGNAFAGLVRVAGQRAWESVFRRGL